MAAMLLSAAGKQVASALVQLKEFGF